MSTQLTPAEKRLVREILQGVRTDDGQRMLTLSQLEELYSRAKQDNLDRKRVVC